MSRVQFDQTDGNYHAEARRKQARINGFCRCDDGMVSYHQSELYYFLLAISRRQPCQKMEVSMYQIV